MPYNYVLERKEAQEKDESFQPAPIGRDMPLHLPPPLAHGWYGGGTSARVRYRVLNHLKRRGQKDPNKVPKQRGRLAEAIVNIEKDDPSLTSLDLNHVPLGPRGAIRLAEVLVGNTHLKNLYLEDNNLNGQDAHALGRMLKVNRTLERLYLQGNHLEEGVESFTRALKLNDTCQVYF